MVDSVTYSLCLSVFCRPAGQFPATSQYQPHPGYSMPPRKYFYMPVITRSSNNMCIPYFYTA